MPNPSALATLERLYTFDPATIGDFLTAHPFLVPLLEEAYPHVVQHFPDDRYSLNLSLGGELELLIHTAQQVNDVLDRLEAIDDEWWLDNAPRAQGLMMIYHEFD